MTIVPCDQAIHHQAHGSTFSSYVSPARGSEQLCAWRLIVPPGLQGAPHRPTREEVVLVLAGDLHVTLDGSRDVLGPGDVVVVPADAELQVDGGTSECIAWVTTTPGLEAELGDGTGWLRRGRPEAPPPPILGGSDLVASLRS